MKIISIDKDNIDEEHICCAIGNDVKNKTREESKRLRKSFGNSRDLL
ncbi:hypothetical protein JWG40_13130 [Leptospira sp. 201903074]|nr:hypothetical protein [Leptospira abararensis]MBM9547969.1 hypothetical protein [Leptospira abararensis]